MQRTRTAVISGILFLSGISALVFQTLWLRLSGLAFGNSVWSAALILSSFMAGLGIGNAIAARARTQRFPALRAYAVLELMVAVLGCTVVFALPALGGMLRPIFENSWDHHATLNALRFGISFLILLVPTTAMGLALPLLLEDEGLQPANFGRTVALLYGWNTIGAVVGALLGEFVLIKALGLWGTGLAAAAASMTAAALAWLVSPRTRAAPVVRERNADRVEPLPWRLLITAFGTGGILLSLEVVWFRFLRLYVSSSSSSFAVMLAVVLAGIGIGSLAMGAFHARWPRIGSLLPVLLLLEAIATILTYVFFPASHGLSGITFVQTLPQIGGRALALMFPGSLLSGMIFPLLAKGVQEKIPGRMNSAGLVTLFNTLGAALGPLLASFVLLPLLGFQTSLLLCASGYAILSVVAMERATVAWAALGVAVIVLFACFPYQRDEAHFANARQPYEIDGSKLARKIEGTADSLQLLERDLYGVPYYFRLVTNGFSMSGTHPASQHYMRTFAYLPLALRPESEDALLICYGVGVTADALVRDPRLKHIDVVDISREVLALAPSYAGPGHPNPLLDPRVSTFVQDGRFFLQASPHQYDVITGEPPPLKTAGTVALYTEEFFRLMNSRLKDGGIASFWLPIYQLKVDEVKAILHAFRRAFPNASVWGGSDHEWIMMGIKGPGRALTVEEFSRLWKTDATREDLVSNGIETPAQLGALFIMDSDEISRIADNTPPLDDLHPKRLSDSVPDMDATYAFAAPYMDGAAALARFSSSPMISQIWPVELRKDLEVLFLVRETRYTSTVKGANWLAELDLYLRNTRLRQPVLEVLKSDALRVAIAEAQSRSATKSPFDLRDDLIASALARRDLATAIKILESKRAGFGGYQATDSDKSPGFSNRNQVYLLAYLYCAAGHPREAEALVASVPKLSRSEFSEWLWTRLHEEFGFQPPAK